MLFLLQLGPRALGMVQCKPDLLPVFSMKRNGFPLVDKVFDLEDLLGPLPH